MGYAVTSVEHNAVWAERNEVICVPYKGTDDYVLALDSPCDAVVVDGMRRTECVLHSIQYARRFIVLDNIDWPEHKYILGNMPEGWKTLLFGPCMRANPFKNQTRIARNWTAVFTNPNYV
jgi:hypothetical protein